MAVRPCGAAPKSFCCSQVLLGVSGWAGTAVVGQGGQRWGGQRLRLSLQANAVLFYPAAPKPGAFLTGLGELCGRCPHWSLLQLLTEVGPQMESPREGTVPVASPEPVTQIHSHASHPFIPQYCSTIHCLHMWC